MGLTTPPALAVIGAGVGGCALVAGLRRGGWGGAISLWESGRGPGGRTATRRSRQDAGLRFDHGAPFFNITATPPALVAPLLASGAIQPWREPQARLDASGRLHPPDPATPLTGDEPSARGDPFPSGDPYTSGALYHGGGGMDQLCRGLLDLADGAGCGEIGRGGTEQGGTGHDGTGQGGAVARHFGVLVRHLAVTPAGRWQLFDATRQLLVEADWLVLAGTLLAHPRSRLLLAWDTVPLQEAARDLGDPDLFHGLAALASMRFQARSNLLLVAGGEAAESWRRCPFRWLRFDPAAEQRWRLSRLSIQPLEDGRVAVVAHSSAVFAAEHLSVYGSRSSIARQLGIQPKGEEEGAVIEALTEAVEGALAAWLAPGLVRQGERQLMRWGAAFPLEPGLPQALALCPRSRVGFCGDYLAGVGFGRVEGSLRSAERLAASLLQAV